MLLSSLRGWLNIRVNFIETKGKFLLDWNSLRCKISEKKNSSNNFEFSFYRQIRDSFLLLLILFFFSRGERTHVWWFTDVYSVARHFLSYLMINLSTMFHSHSRRGREDRCKVVERRLIEWWWKIFWYAHLIWGVFFFISSLKRSMTERKWELLKN